MASPCNSLNVQTIKVSQLPLYTPTRKDFVMVVQSGSTLTSKRSSINGLFSSIFNGTGSYSGSFTGSLKGELIGTASYAKTASYVKFGTGTTNYYTIWTNADDISGNSGGSDILNSDNNVKFEKAVNIDYGTSGKKLYFYSQSLKNFVGFGSQPYKTYFRTTMTEASNNSFVWYCGGIHEELNSSNYNPGISGSTVLGTYYDNVGIGGFGDPTTISSILHLHLTASKLQNSAGAFSNPNTKTPWVTPYAEALTVARRNPFRITSGSNPGVSSTTTTSAGAILLNVSASGQLDVKGDIVAFSTYGSSDQRLKSNIVSLENANETLAKLRPVSFTWNANNKLDFGLIAQEVEKELPELIKEDLGGFKVVKYTSLIPFLIQEIQQLRKEVDELKSKIK